jgi:hypothetical protein
MRAILRDLLILCVVVCTVFVFGYVYGRQQGITSTQVKWDTSREAERIAVENALAALRSKLAEQETAHAERQEQVTYELAQARESHAVDLVRIDRQHQQRLLQSAHRAQVYRDQAEAGAIACHGLAGHAARLDRTLEEGRSLVDEFRNTLEFRDRQLILLGEQILADRRLMAEESN